jgi:hypothetical protein
MKKYLIKGLLALFVGSIAASCTDHDVEYVPIAQQKTQAYNAAFKELIGGNVDPNQNWGFEGTPASVIEEEETPTPALTRGDENLDGGFTISSGDWQNFDYYNVSKVQEIIGKLPERQAAGNKLNDYEFISKGAISFNFVYAVTSGLDEIGYYYYNPSSGINSRTEVKLINNIQDDHYTYELFTYGRADNTWSIPTINPNTDSNDCLDLINSQTINQVRGRTVTLRIPVGYRIGFYIKNPDWNGLKMYSNKSLNADGNYYSAVVTLSDGTYAVGLEDWIASTGGDFDCNDIVLTVKNINLPEIINYNSSTTKHYKHRRIMAQGRVFCEDLGTAGIEDLDFNDIVFDARIWRTYEFDRIDNGGKEHQTDYKYEADIRLLAAGGTIPVKLLNKYNVHDRFSGSPGMTTMINTVDDHANVTVTWDNMKANPGAASTIRNEDITDIINDLITKAKNETPSRDHNITVNDIPISVLWASSEDPASFGTSMGAVGELHAEEGQVPHKFCLPIGTKWPSERRKFVLAYPGFEDWAKDENVNKEFYKSPDSRYIYSDVGCDATLDLYNSDGVEYTVGYTDDIIISEETTKTTEIETVVWAPVNGWQLNDWGDNHLIYDDIFAKMDDTLDDNTYTIRIYGTVAQGATEWGAQLLTAEGWNNMTVYGAVRNDHLDKGYIEYTNISQALVRILKNTKGNDNGVAWSCNLQGKNYTATQISFVRTVTTNH